MTGRTQVPDGWLVARLGDVADWVNGLAFRDIQFSEIGKPIIRIAELKAGITTETKFTNQCFDQSVHIRQGDLLFAWSGQPETSINSFWWNGPEGWLNQHIFRVTTRPQVNTTFFYYLLRHLNSVFVRIARGKQTAGLGHVTKEELFKMVAAFPPMWEQKAIAAALGGVDEAIERTEEAIAATERLRDALLHELLTRGVPDLHSEWKEAPGIGTIPACWDVVRLGDVAEVQTGRAVNRKAIRTEGLEIPYLSVANVKDGYLDLGIVKNMLVLVDEIDRYKLRDDDVLFTEGGDADKLGRGAVWRNEIALCLHQNHVFAVRPRQGVLTSDFLASFAASRYGKRYFLSAAKQTTNLASVNASQLKLMPMPLPTLPEQQTIVAALDGVDEAIEQARQERNGLQLLKASAADALLTGARAGGISLKDQGKDNWKS